MTAAALVADLRARGVTLEPRGNKLAVRPASRLTPAERLALREHKLELLALLGAPPAPDAAVAQRVAAFREQFEQWTRARRTGVPILCLPGVEVRAGHCLSCGDPLATGRTYRCAPCVAAAESVLGLPPILGA